MGKVRFSRAAFSLASSLLCGLSLGQGLTVSQVGVPQRGAAGIRETVKTIMSRQAKAAKRAPFFKYEENEGPDRHHLPQNPLSPLTASFPELSPRGFGADRPGPKFSVAGGFTATDFNDSQAWPPDTMGAVSPTQVLVCVNGRIRVFDKSGTMGALNADTDVFFNSVKTSGWFTTDPRVRWDSLSQRWFVVMIDAPASSGTNNRIMIAVSSGATIDASTTWSFFQFQQAVGNGDTTKFFDYPTLGIDKDALYIGGNVFGSSFSGCDAFVVRKSDLLAGTLTVTPFRSLCTSTGAGPYTPQGVDNDDPNSTEGYFIGVDNAAFGKLDVVRVSNPGGTPTISASAALTVPSTYYAPDAPNGTTAGRKLDSLDDRLFAAKIQVNRYTGTRTLWTAHNIGVTSAGVGSSSATRAASRWYEIQGFGTGSTPSLVQSGTLYDSAASGQRYFWIPSIAMNGQGYAVLGSTYSSTTEGPGVSVAYRFTSDTLGTLRTPLLPQTGTAGYADQSGLTVQRWGDYSHTVVDPADGMTVWTFQEYAKTTTAYGVRVTKLLAPAPAAITSIDPVVAGTTQNITITGTTTNGTAFFEGGSSYTNHIAAAVSGSGVTVNSITVNSATSVTLNVTTALNAATGTRTVTITNPDGQAVTGNLSVSARTVVAAVTLEDFAGDLTTIPVTVEIRQPGTTTVVETTTGSLDASGNLSVRTTLGSGTYDVALKASHWLRKVVANVAFTSTGASGVTASLINGDVNGDNQITATDQALLAAAYRSRPTSGNWNANADLNGDGQVSATDQAILAKNYRKRGDN